MSKKMLINATHPEEHRVAIVEDGALSELDIEITSRQQTKGNIYKAVVVRVETGLQAAFVDYGGERPGFLQIGEIHPSFHKTAADSDSKYRPRITDMLKRGQELLVQVVKEERGTKGAALTTYLSLPGRYMVLMPESDTKGISRKIEVESTRKKLKQLMNSMELPDSIGYIVRTAGIGQKKSELKRDVDYLLRVYEKICELGKQAKAPALVYKESNLVIRSIRDYFSPDIDEVLVDDPKAAQEGKEFFQEVMPEYAQLVKLHQERRPIFSRYQIEEQIEVLSRNKVPLPSGGSIVIDSTEALVAIDVNSGKMATEKGVEATAFKTNMEAAAEAARQLRLRDLGGLIVIDFIDMRDRKHIRDVEKCLKDTLKSDKARVSVGRISQFGLLEMSRQRIKSALSEGSYLPCPHCEGSGRIKSAEAQSLNFVRRLCAGLAKGQIGKVEGQVPLEVAAYLLNNKRAELIRLEQQYDVTIYIQGMPELTNGQLELEFLRREKEELKEVQNYVEASSLRSAAPSDESITSDEVEGPPSISEQQPETVAASDPEGETDLDSAAPPPSTRKRRRPRRRRKPSETRLDQVATTASPDEELTGEPQPVAENQLPEPGPEAAPRDETTAAVGPQTMTAPPHGVLSGIRQLSLEQDPGSAAENERVPAPESEPHVDEKSVEKTDRPKPRRRKPATTKKPVLMEPQPVPDPLTTPESAVATGSDETTPETTAAAKPKPPRRRRSSAAKKAVAVNGEQQGPSLPTEAAGGETVASKQGEEKPAEKPKRRRPRKPAAAPKLPTPTADAAEPKSAGSLDQPAAATNGNQAEAESKKKAPRRRPSPKKPQDARAKAADAKQEKTEPPSDRAKGSTDGESDSH